MIFDGAENRYEFNMLYVDRRRWIKRRNQIIKVLKIFGVSIFSQCSIANGIMSKLGYTTPKIMEDRYSKLIVK